MEGAGYTGPEGQLGFHVLLGSTGDTMPSLTTMKALSGEERTDAAWQARKLDRDLITPAINGYLRVEPAYTHTYAAGLYLSHIIHATVMRSSTTTDPSRSLFNVV